MEVRFVDRVWELESLREYSSCFRALVLYLYGPEGCGKTRLLREFVSRFDDFFGKDAIAIYIDAIEERDIMRAIASSQSISRVLNVFEVGLEVSRDLVQQHVPLGQALSRSLSLLIDRVAEKAFKKSLEDKLILVVIDDVARVIGLDRIEWYVKWLYELKWKLNEEYKARAVNFIATTSEGISRRIIAKHSHGRIEIIWNLERRGFEDLFSQLNPPGNILFEDLWRILGGNPRKLIELTQDYMWSINDMIKAYKIKLQEVVRDIYGVGLGEELRRTVDDIKYLDENINRKTRMLTEILEKHNLILYKYWIKMKGGEFIEVDDEIGLGKYYAWQTPLYREALKKILRENSFTG